MTSCRSDAPGASAIEILRATDLIRSCIVDRQNGLIRSLAGTSQYGMQTLTNHL
jgi:hypothetical protein